MAKLKLGIAKLNSTVLIFYCISIQNKMKSNAHLPNSTPSLTEIDAKCESLKKLNIQGKSGDRIAIVGRNAAAEELKKLLRTLSLYIALIDDGNGVVILSSGYEISREPSPTAPLSRPAALLAKRSDREGQVKLKWVPARNAVNCQIEITTTESTDSQTQWESVGVTSKSTFVVEDLTPGKYYWFRIRAFGRRYESPYSNPALIMAA
jgi:hypothetical protein